MNMIVVEDEKSKKVRSSEYNYNFDKITGKFLRWGATLKDNPVKAPMPEIADIEISSGKCHNSCPFCYKGNKKDGKLHNMSFNEFKKIFSLLTQGNLLTQIAFGITSPLDNPDFFKMMLYSKEHGVVPNYTCNGTDMTEEIADKSKMCGAIALSVNDIEKTYNATKMLTDKGFKQVNWHVVAHNGSFDKIMSLIEDINEDEHLKGLNALVLLKYKPKGTNAGKFTSLTQEQYNQIFDYAEKKKVRLGFDSCSCHSYLNAIKDKEGYVRLSEYAEPCESTLFSIYINSHCEVSPCSFCENETRDNGEDWKQGINVLEISDFEKEVWQNPKIKNFRERLLSCERNCPMFNLKDEV